MFFFFYVLVFKTRQPTKFFNDALAGIACGEVINLFHGF